MFGITENSIASFRLVKNVSYPHTLTLDVRNNKYLKSIDDSAARFSINSTFKESSDIYNQLKAGFEIFSES